MREGMAVIATVPTDETDERRQRERLLKVIEASLKKSREPQASVDPGTSDAGDSDGRERAQQRSQGNESDL